MKKYDLIEAGNSVWVDGVNFEGILSKLTLRSLEEYTNQMNKKLYVIRGVYDNALAVKEEVDKMIRENNDVLKSHGLDKSTQLSLVLE